MSGPVFLIFFSRYLLVQYFLSRRSFGELNRCAKCFQISYDVPLVKILLTSSPRLRYGSSLNERLIVASSLKRTFAHMILKMTISSVGWNNLA